MGLKASLVSHWCSELPRPQRLLQSSQKRGGTAGVHPQPVTSPVLTKKGWHCKNSSPTCAKCSELTLSAGLKPQGWLCSLFIPLFTSTNVSSSCSRGKGGLAFTAWSGEFQAFAAQVSEQQLRGAGHTTPVIHGCLFCPIHRNSAKVNAALMSTWVLKPVLSQLCNS